MTSWDALCRCSLDRAKGMLDEKTMLTNISMGDESAFKEMFVQYYPKVKVFLGQFIGNQDDAKDVAQNIFVKIWLQRRLLPELRSFSAFLYTMTRNAAIDYGRIHKIRIHLDAVETASERDHETESGFFAKELQVRISHAVAEMPEKRRKVFIMSRLEGRTGKEIAETLGISRKTVENHINLALRELRKLTKVIILFMLITQTV